jgi:hypothetical protein
MEGAVILDHPRLDAADLACRSQQDGVQPRCHNCKILISKYRFPLDNAREQMQAEPSRLTGRPGERRTEMYGYVLSLTNPEPRGRVLGPAGVTWTPGMQALVFRVDEGWSFQLVEWDELDGFYWERDPVGPFPSPTETEAAARAAAAR